MWITFQKLMNEVNIIFENRAHKSLKIYVLGDDFLKLAALVKKISQIRRIEFLPRVKY